jgi:hypothetical protein
MEALYVEKKMHWRRMPLIVGLSSVNDGDEVTENLKYTSKTSELE